MYVEFLIFLNYGATQYNTIHKKDHCRLPSKGIKISLLYIRIQLIKHIPKYNLVHQYICIRQKGKGKARGKGLLQNNKLWFNWIYLVVHNDSRCSERGAVAQTLYAHNPQQKRDKMLQMLAWTNNNGGMSTMYVYSLNVGFFSMRYFPKWIKCKA